MNKVIGLIGAKSAGKTTAFNTIKQALEVEEITLAGKLKDVSAKVFDIPRDWFDSHSKKEKDLEDPVFLTRPAIESIWNNYAINFKAVGFYDKHIRPHVGQVLHTPRQIAQYVGTEVLRAYEADIHCLEACKAISKDIGVVTDMRFPNEYAFFKNNYPNFFPIYIHNIRAEVSAGKDSHASEAHLYDLAKKAVIKIDNNGSVREFEEKIQKYLKEVENAR